MDYSYTTHRTAYLRNCMLLIAIFVFSVPVFAQPTVTSFSPASGPVGTSVTITGTNFSATPVNNIVFFGAVKANVITATATSLTVTVPAGATYQPITVLAGGLTGYSSKPFLLTFSGGGQITPGSFDIKQDFVTGIRPNAVTLSDFDGDGKSDIATPNNHSAAGFASVSVLRNISNPGTIAFAPKQDFVTGAVTYAIASGDIDGDGKPDMVSNSIGDANFSVFRNTSSTGAISFAPKVDIASGTSSFGVVIGDIDGDGKPDVVTLNNTVQTISVFRNTGSPGTISFAPKVDFSTLLFPQAIVVSDFDGDGKTDIAFTNKLSNSFSVYRNTSTAGTISMAARIDYTCGSGNEPYGITAGDLDGDSKMDLAVVINNNTGGGAQLFRNLGAPGTISFAFNNSVASGAASNTCYHAGINDINGDGKPDLAITVGGSSSGQSQVYQNFSAGSLFSFGASSNIFSSFAPYGIFFGDLEGDSKPDLVISEFTLEKISAYKNRSGLPNVTSFSPTTAGTNASVTISGNNFSGVSAVTFGGVPAASFGTVNSTTIIATVGLGASGDVAVTTALGTGSLPGFTFAAPPTISSFTPTSAGIGTTVTITGSDFNGTTAVNFGGVAATSFTVVNGTTITAVLGAGATGSVSVTNGFGTGSLPGFTYLVPVITSFAPLSAGTGTVVAITGNNLTGATAVSFGGTPATSFTVLSATSITAEIAGGSTGNVVVATPIGTATLGGFTFISPPPPIITSFTPLSGNVGSTVTINGANFNTVTTNNVVYFGATRATVTTATATQLTVTVPAGATFQPLSVLNLGNNLTGFSNAPFVSTFPNGGVINASSFPEHVDISTFGGPSSGVLELEVGDLDGDGKPDMVFSFVNGPVGICRNTGSAGTISFLPISYLAGFTSQRVSLGDIDGDGKLDIIGIAGGSLAVARNTSTAGTISFAPAVSFLSGLGNQKIGISDMNGDGKADLVLPFSGSLLLSVVKNTSIPGVISLGAKTDLACLGQGQHIRIGDLDGDGKKDIVISYGFASANISVYRNTGVSGGISFAPKVDFATGFNSGNIAIGDIDGDSKPDICVTNLSELFFSIFRNNASAGTISFESRMDITVPTNVFTKYVDIGDVDGDSKPDIIVGVNFTAPGILIYKNNSTAGAITVTMGAQIDSGNPWSTNLADMDGDGKPDIIGLIPDWNFISVFKNKVNIPVISSFSPASGTTGTSITITGNNFIGTTAVSFGGVPAQSFTVNSATSINAIVSNGATGSVSVTTPAGIATRTGFTYFLVPSVTSFTPTSGTTGTAVTITGTNFAGATAVSFGGVAAQSFVVNSSTSITAVVGTGASGSVAVSNPVGSGSLAGFTFNTAPPTINAIAPGLGVAGISVIITGTNFTGATAVSFGGVPAASYTVNSSTSITAIVGTGASGNVEVVTPAGTATYGAFTFLPTPTITSFSPTSGGQGTVMTITGTNFTFLQNISIGGLPVASLVSANATTLVVTVGTGASGNVVVTTQGGGVASSPGFIFIPAPTIGSFTPASAGTGSTVTITGTNFTGATSVSFGGTAASSFTVVNATSITAVIGAGATGNVNITTPGGTASIPGFIYTVVTSVRNVNSNSVELKVSPNPANDMVSVTHPASVKTTYLKLIDINGRLIKLLIPARNSAQTLFSVKGVATGLYKLIWTDGKKYYRRTVIITQ
jgi:FG-GAP-like repeat/IPT/TIG domain/Secretion system C-terminal sorting domain